MKRSYQFFIQENNFVYLFLSEIICPRPPNVTNSFGPYNSEMDAGVYRLSNRSFYSCEPGTRFSDGTQSKDVTCTLNGTWSRLDDDCRGMELNKKCRSARTHSN